MVYAPAAEKDVRDFFDHTNISVPYGTCPVPSQVIQITDWVPGENSSRIIDSEFSKIRVGFEIFLFFA